MQFTFTVTTAGQTREVQVEADAVDSAWAQVVATALPDVVIVMHNQTPAESEGT
jgi:hypothetical protein